MMAYRPAWAVAAGGADHTARIWSTSGSLTQMGRSHVCKMMCEALHWQIHYSVYS